MYRRELVTVVASVSIVAAYVTQQGGPRPDCSHLPPTTAPAAAINDNRTPTGTVVNGTLELRLVVQQATWYPEGERGCGVSMVAFGEEGKTPQIPAPLIRVPLGTRLHVTVRNAYTTPLTMRGLQDRVADSVARRLGVNRATFGALGDFSGVTIGPDSSHTFEFRANEPGTFFYHAARQNTPPGAVSADHVGQAVGGFIVDPPGGSPPDRIFVMTRWRGPPNSPARASQRWELLAFNGRSWPHTEPLTATVGDTLRWRVISANNDGHAMHLHGFYFTVQSKGTMAYDSPFPGNEQPMVVTEGLGPGRTLTMTWIPERPGNWIFHCHVMRHMSGAQRLDRMPGANNTGRPDPAHDSHAMHEMAGLVMGIKVDAASGHRVNAEESPRATLRLFANRRENVFGTHPGYGFVLQEGAAPPARDSVRIPGTPLFLRRGEPTQISVINRTGAALGVHWHGIELESYYDGVTGWSGAGERIAPPIANNDSFAVRMTPPRAGTFIYHVHNERGEELPSGLYGPLLVLEPGAQWDPEYNKLFVISEPGPGAGLGAEKPPFVNGTANPDTVRLEAGRPYRFRIISIPASVAHSLQVTQDGRVIEWTPLARDGADFTPAMRHPEPASYPVIDEGITLDFEFRSRTPGLFLLELRPLAAGRALSPTVVPIRVR